MGEAKRRRDRQQLIAASWRSYESMVLPPDVSDVQRTETRLAFYAGATALFHSITQALSSGDEIAPADLAMMDALHHEIDEFAKTFDSKVEKRRPGAVAEALAERAATHSLGDGPIEKKHRANMTATIQALDEVFNGKVGGPDRKVGLVLMVFPFGDDTGRCNYASNGASREDIVILMKEMIARFEGQPEIEGHA